MRSRAGRRNSDVIKMPKKVVEESLMCRVPAAELPADVQQYRIMLVFRHLEDVQWDEPVDSPHSLDDPTLPKATSRHCELRVSKGR